MPDFEAIEAAYRTICARCGGLIQLGEWIIPDQVQNLARGRWQHVTCPDDWDADLRPTERVCGECFIVKPCPCDDGL